MQTAKSVEDKTEADLLNYADYLRGQVESEGRKRKGERTRDKLKIAAAQLLNQCAYRDLRVTDVCDQAGIAPGTFYLYFQNKRDLTIEVLSEFVEMFHMHVQQTGPKDPFLAIQQANIAYVKMALANPGLIRCVLQVSDEEPEFARFQQRISDRWYTKVASAVTRRLDSPNPGTVLLVTHALGSMMDDATRRLVTTTDPYLTKAIDDLDLDIEGFCLHLSVIWYRTLYGEDPPGLEKGVAQDFKALRIKKKK